MAPAISTTPVRCLIFASGRVGRELAASASKPRPQVGPGNRHPRRMTESDRILDGATALTLEDCVTAALAHDFAPGTTAEAAIDGQRFKRTLQTETSVGPPAPKPRRGR